MAFDGVFVHKLNTELSKTLEGTRVDKIHQPTYDELVLFLRGKSGNYRLLINASSNPRIYISSTSPENPAVPYMFCMLLRKHLVGARLSGVGGMGLERMTLLEFETFNEMGDAVKLRLAVELIPTGANVILINEDSRIIDALRKSDLENAARIIHPGATYSPPSKQQKLDPTGDVQALAKAVVASNRELWQAVLSTLDGVGPLAAREIAAKADFDPTAPASKEEQEQKLLDALTDFKNNVIKDPLPTLVKKDDRPVDFYFFPPKSYGEGVTLKDYPTLSELCDEFFKEKDLAERMASRSSELKKQLSTLRARASRKLAARQSDLAGCEGVEEIRIKGELIKANLHSIKRGAESAILVNYYSENCDTVTVDLDVTLSPAENAARYFKEYKKKMSAKGKLYELIESSRAEIDYIESVSEALSRATTGAELEEIKRELCEQGYIKAAPSKKAKPPKVTPLKLLSPDGFLILVGRNNLENDRITTELAEKKDIWFHTKDIHGSHVVIKTEGKTPDNKTLTMAAELAAYNSKARNSKQVPVDYTLIKFVKKPSGSRPGAVIYTNHQTAYVDPVNHIK